MNPRKLGVVLTMAVAALIAAGCDSHPATSTARHGQSSSGVTIGCVAELTVGWADNGSTHCVQRHGSVTVALRSSDGSVYTGTIEVSGTSLQAAPTPGRSPWSVYVAVSSGTTVISLPPYVCQAGPSCLSGPPWLVTIVVR